MTVTPEQHQAMADTARIMLRDRRQAFTDMFVALGGMEMFMLSVPSVQATSLLVTVNGDPLDVLDYEVDQEASTVTLTATADDSVRVQGFHYEWFTDQDLLDYVSIALDNYTQSEGSTQLAHYLTQPAYANVLAIAGLVEGLWALLSEVARDIDVLSPEQNVPATQRFRQLYQLLTYWTEELRRRESSLNIGLYKVEMFNLRRISRLTGRYVPEYIPQEFDDTTAPIRLYPPIDDGILGPPPLDDDPFPDDITADIPRLDLTEVAGDDWRTVVELFDPVGDPLDVSDSTFTAQIRESTTSPTVAAHYTVDDTDADVGLLVLELGNADSDIPGRWVWDLQRTDGAGRITTLLGGSLTVARGVTD